MRGPLSPLKSGGLFCLLEGGSVRDTQATALAGVWQLLKHRAVGCLPDTPFLTYRSTLIVGPCLGSHGGPRQGGASFHVRDAPAANYRGIALHPDAPFFAGQAFSRCFSWQDSKKQGLG